MVGSNTIRVRLGILKQIIRGPLALDPPCPRQARVDWTRTGEKVTIAERALIVIARLDSLFLKGKKSLFTDVTFSISLVTPDKTSLTFEWNYILSANE